MVLYVSLTVIQGCGKRPKSVPQIHFGTVPALIFGSATQFRVVRARRHWLGESLPGASSRTTVTKFSAMRRYRFFPQAARESGNAPASLTSHFAEDAALEIAAVGDCPLGSVLGPTGEHAGPAAVDASWGLLLSLFPGEEPGKLREDVRTAEVRVALVGDVLRESAKPFRWRQSRSRAALAPQGSRGARPAVSPTRQESSLSARWPDFGRPIGTFASQRIHGGACRGFPGFQI